MFCMHETIPMIQGGFNGLDDFNTPQNVYSNHVNSCTSAPRTLFYHGDNKANFSSSIKQILCEIKLKTSYKDRSFIDINYARENLMDHVKNDWRESAQKKSKLQLFNDIKQEFGVEKYLLLNIDKYEKSLLSQLCYGILPLRIETGRFCNEKNEERLCTLCDTNMVESIEHFLFDCSMYEAQRSQFINNVHSSIENWEYLTQQECLAQLFKLKPRALIRKICERNIFVLAK